MQMGHPRQHCMEIMCRACKVEKKVCVCVIWMQAGYDAAGVLQEECVGGGVDGCGVGLGMELKAR